MQTRNKSFLLRLTEQEYATLKRKSELAGLKMNPFVVSLINGCEIHPRAPDSCKALARQVAAVGNKLNRIYEQLGYTVPKKISADRKNAETRRQMPDPMLTRGKTMEDIDPRPSFKTVAAQLRKAAARSAECAVNATRKEER